MSDPVRDYLEQYRRDRGEAPPSLYDQYRAEQEGGILAKAARVLGAAGKGIGHLLADQAGKAYDTFFTPVEGERVTTTSYLRGKSGPVPGSLAPGTVITKQNTPSAQSPEEFKRAALETSVLAAAPLAEVGLAGGLAKAGLPSLASKIAAGGAANAAAGAALDSEDRLRGAGFGAGAGVLLPFAPAILRSRTGRAAVGAGAGALLGDDTESRVKGAAGGALIGAYAPPAIGSVIGRAVGALERASDVTGGLGEAIAAGVREGIERASPMFDTKLLTPRAVLKAEPPSTFSQILREAQRAIGEAQTPALARQSAMPRAASSLEESTLPRPGSVSASSELSAGAQVDPVHSWTAGLPPTSTTRTTIVPSSTEVGGARTFIVGSLEGSIANKRIYQPTGDLNSLLERTRAVLPQYRQDLDEIAQAIPGAQLYGARHKVYTAAGELNPDGLARVERKLAGLEKKGGGAEYLSDLIGGRMLVDDPTDAQRIIEVLESRGYRVFEDDNFLHDAASRGGYRARHLMVETPEGVSAELQLMTPEMSAAQAAPEGHGLYELLRTHPDPTSDEYRQIAAQMQAHYDAAYQASETRLAQRRAGNPARGHTGATMPLPIAGDDLVSAELERVGAELPQMKRRKGETPEAFRKRQRVYEPVVRRVIAGVIQSKEYQEMRILAEVLVARDHRFGGQNPRDLAAELQRGLLESAVREAGEQLAIGLKGR